jgi:hypothetical protein
MKAKGDDGSGRRRSIIEQVSEWSFFRATGKWHFVRRIVDRKTDRYFEHITDENGELIRECEERLTDHQGRGTAKKATRS